MSDTRTKEQIEADWWAAWWDEDYTWDGLAKKPLQGWVVADGVLREAATRRVYGQAAPEKPEPVTGGPASIQDYWRADPASGRLRAPEDMKDELISEPSQPVFHRIHLPLAYKDGAPTGKAYWADDALDVLINPRFFAAVDAVWEDERKHIAVRANGHAQLCGAVLLRTNYASGRFGKISLYADRTVFTRTARFRRAELCGTMHFKFAMFFEAAEFENAGFAADAVFDNAIFLHGVSFDEARFSGNVSFGSATFFGSASFANLDFLAEARFHTAVFLGEVDFQSAKFWGDASFNSATFSKGAQFDRAIFKSEANLESAAFLHSAHFKRAGFFGETNFADVAFTGSVDFCSASFRSSTSFKAALFLNVAHFEITTFSKGVSFVSAIFEGAAQFDAAAFKSRINFDTAIFRRFADFAKVDLPAKEADWRGGFDGALFEATLDARGIDAKGVSLFEGARFDRGVMLERIDEKDERKAHKDALDLASRAPDREIALRALESGALKLKQAMEAEKDYAREQRFHRLELRARRKLKATSPTEKAFSGAYLVFARYGGSIAVPAGWLVAAIAVFAGVYWSLEQGLGSVGASLRRAPIDLSADPNLIEAARYSLSRVFPLGTWDASDEPLQVVQADTKRSGGPKEDQSDCSFRERLVAAGGCRPAAVDFMVQPQDGAPYEDRSRLELHRTFIAMLSTLQTVFAGALYFLLGLAVRRKFQIS